MQDSDFETVFPKDGRFLSRSVKGRRYWYHESASSEFNSNGRRYRRYVGPCDDPEMQDRVNGNISSIDDPVRRRQAVIDLRNAGLPAPTATDGGVIKALSRAGVFRVRSMLVGSVAYQTYSGLLGLKLPSAAIRTEDVDIALDFGVANSIDDRSGDVLALLRSFDGTFHPRPHISDRVLMSSFRTSSGYQVEFLTTHRGSDEHTGHLSRLPCLGMHIGGVPLTYLDFLIRDPVRSLLLHDAGIAVTVPAPARFAVHKLLVAASRSADNPKILKDLAQSSELITAFELNGNAEALRTVWREARERDFLMGRTSVSRSVGGLYGRRAAGASRHRWVERHVGSFALTAVIRTVGGMRRADYWHDCDRDDSGRCKRPPPLGCSYQRTRF